MAVLSATSDHPVSLSGTTLGLVSSLLERRTLLNNWTQGLGGMFAPSRTGEDRTEPGREVGLDIAGKLTLGSFKDKLI